MNKKFAKVLQLALDAKKLNETKLVSEFIEFHGTCDEEVSLAELRHTPEIDAFLTQFFKKKVKCKDKNLVSAFETLFLEIEKPQSTKVNSVYRAEEY